LIAVAFRTALSEHLGVEAVLPGEICERPLYILRRVVWYVEVGGLGEAVVFGLGAYVLVVDTEPIECVPDALHRSLVPDVPHAQHRLTWHRSPPRGRTPKASVFLDQLPISVQFSALTRVADEIRVHAGVVLAAALRIESPYQGPCAHLRGDEDLVPLPST